MKNCLQELRKDYDYILIDCMPSLGMITINALASADKVIIPVEAQFLPAKGMSQLLRTVNKVRKQINPNLKVEGVLITFVDKRTNLSKATYQQLQENYGSMVKIFDTQIPRTTKMAESTASGKSIFNYDKSGKVSEAYSLFTKEVLENEQERNKNAIAKVR